MQYTYPSHLTTRPIHHWFIPLTSATGKTPPCQPPTVTPQCRHIRLLWDFHVCELSTVITEVFRSCLHYLHTSWGRSPTPYSLLRWSTIHIHKQQHGSRHAGPLLKAHLRTIGKHISFFLPLRRSSQCRMKMHTKFIERAKRPRASWTLTDTHQNSKINSLQRTRLTLAWQWRYGWRNALREHQVAESWYKWEWCRDLRDALRRFHGIF